MKLPKRQRRALRELAENCVRDVTAHGLDGIEDFTSADLVRLARRLDGARAAIVAIDMGALPPPDAPDHAALCDAIDFNRDYMLGAVFDDRADIASGLECVDVEESGRTIARDSAIIETLDTILVGLKARHRRYADERFAQEVNDAKVADYAALIVTGLLRRPANATAVAEQLRGWLRDHGLELQAVATAPDGGRS